MPLGYSWDIFPVLPAATLPGLSQPLKFPPNAR